MKIRDDVCVKRHLHGAAWNVTLLAQRSRIQWNVEVFVHLIYSHV